MNKFTRYALYATLLLLTLMVSCNSPEVENVDRSRKSLVGVWKTEEFKLQTFAPREQILVLNESGPSYFLYPNELPEINKNVIMQIEWEIRDGRILVVNPNWWVIGGIPGLYDYECSNPIDSTCFFTISDQDSLLAAVKKFGDQDFFRNKHEESIDSLAWYFTKELDTDLLSFTTEECRKQNNNTDNLDGLCTIRRFRRIQLPQFDEWLANLDTISSTEYWKAWEAEVDTTSN